MSTRLLLLIVALFALLWAMPPRRRRGRGRRRRGERRVDLNALWESASLSGGSEAWDRYNRAAKEEEARKVREERRKVRGLLRRRPGLIRGRRRRGRRRGLASTLGIMLITALVILLIAVVMGMSGTQPFKTYTDKYLPFAALAPAPLPAPTATITPIPATPSTGSIPTAGIAVSAASVPTETSTSLASAPLLVSTPTPSLVPPTMTPASPTATVTPVPPTRTPTPVPPPLRHIGAKSVMLDLVNEERVKAGVPPVELGDNWAAQLHAESSLANCVSSHWGVDGLTPYMRYSLAGGYQSNGENGSGLDYCHTHRDRVTLVKPIGQEMADSVKGFMGSPGHRANLLYPHHRKLNIGLAFDRYNIYIYQHFEGDHVEYDSLPAINEQGFLTLRGSTKNGVTFDENHKLGVQIFYHRLTHSLTRGQVSRTYCYGTGNEVAFVREPWEEGESGWTGGTYSAHTNTCPDPYDVSPDAPAAQSAREALDLWDEAYELSQRLADADQRAAGLWLVAKTWDVGNTSFDVKVDMTELLDQHGNGVYTVVLWGRFKGHAKRDDFSKYSIWYGVEPPDAYRGEQ